MKNFAVTLFLACVFVFSSINSFAGDIPIMGKSCPQNTTCVVEGQIPIGGLSSVDTQEDDSTIFKTVIDYLAQLFG